MITSAGARESMQLGTIAEGYCRFAVTFCSLTVLCLEARWFVLAQTEGQEYKPAVANNAWDRGKALEALNIEERPPEMIDGNCQGYSHHRVIAINPLANNPLKATINEMAHILCGHTTEDMLPTQSQRHAISGKQKRSRWLS
jgi:hypothetical protein